MTLSSSQILARRQQPLLELVQSEENYVHRLQTVCETYMPIVQFIPGDHSTPQPARSEHGSKLSKSISHPPQPCMELAMKWRVIWGNWLQLTEWHTAFLLKLKCAVQDDPDRVPEIFINSRTRLRSMYMKYCENHSKATALVSHYKGYFEELRLYFFDKNDLLSHLMQPIQRMTRYQLPMIEALKITELAAAPKTQIWIEAISMLKDIPKDVQLMMEAGRIVGFSGCITGLGNVRLFGAMHVARITRAELSAAQAIAWKHKQEHQVNNSAHQVSSTQYYSCCDPTSPTPPSSPGSSSDMKGPVLFYNDYGRECAVCPEVMKGWTAARESTHIRFTDCRVFLFDQSLLITEDDVTAKLVMGNRNNFGSFSSHFGHVVHSSESQSDRFWEPLQASAGRVERGAGVHSDEVTNPTESQQSSNPTAITPHSAPSSCNEGRSPSARRGMLIRRQPSNLCFDNESKDNNTSSNSSFQSWSRFSSTSSSDPFRQSAYKFLHSVKVNRMNFMPHWLSSELSVRNLLSESAFYREAVKAEVNSTPNVQRAHHHRRTSRFAITTPYFLEALELLTERNLEITTVPKYLRSNSDNLKSSIIIQNHPEELTDSHPNFLCSKRDCISSRTPDWLWFAVSDESPGSDSVYIFNPGNERVRDAWLCELMDIQQMQANLQLALQNPTRFQCAVRQQNKTTSSGDMRSVSIGASSYNIPKNEFSERYSTAELVCSTPQNLFKTSKKDASFSRAYTCSPASSVCMIDRLASNDSHYLDQKPLHFRGVSAPHVDSMVAEGLTRQTSISGNPSLDSWIERFESMKVCTPRLRRQDRAKQSSSDNCSQASCDIPQSPTSSETHPDDVFYSPPLSPSLYPVARSPGLNSKSKSVNNSGDSKINSKALHNRCFSATAPTENEGKVMLEEDNLINYSNEMQSKRSNSDNQKSKILSAISLRFQQSRKPFGGNRLNMLKNRSSSIETPSVKEEDETISPPKPMRNRILRWSTQSSFKHRISPPSKSERSLSPVFPQTSIECHPHTPITSSTTTLPAFKNLKFRLSFRSSHRTSAINPKSI